MRQPSDFGLPNNAPLYGARNIGATEWFTCQYLEGAMSHFFERGAAFEIAALDSDERIITGPVTVISEITVRKVYL